MLETLRDAAIVLLAAETIIVFIVLGLAGWQIWRLVKHIKGYIDQYATTGLEILDTVKDTAKTTAEAAQQAQGTASFVGDRTARPVIELYSALAGASHFARVVFRARSKSDTEEKH